MGLPIVSTFDMEAKPVRSDLKTTAKFIEEDLKKAITYNVQEGMYRFTADVAKAYLARLYFWCQDWGNAIPGSKRDFRKISLAVGAGVYGYDSESEHSKRKYFVKILRDFRGFLFRFGLRRMAKRDAKYQAPREKSLWICLSRKEETCVTLSLSMRKG